jgi:Flp pilus assembly protein TadG
MMRTSSLFRDTNAAAAAEMALVLPILLILIFGSVELGNYFMSEHAVEKAVRNASRYAARLPISNFDCTTGTMEDPTPVQELARTGKPDGTDDDARLRDWTDKDMTTVTVACDTDTSHTYVNGGIYTDFPMGVPVVTVSATVPYTTLFGILGLGAGTIDLNASQQAAVTGA